MKALLQKAIQVAYFTFFIQVFHQALAKEPGIRERIIASIAPGIYGENGVKAAIALR